MLLSALGAAGASGWDPVFSGGAADGHAAKRHAATPDPAVKHYRFTEEISGRLYGFEAFGAAGNSAGIGRTGLSALPELGAVRPVPQLDRTARLRLRRLPELDRTDHPRRRDQRGQPVLLQLHPAEIIGIASDGDRDWQRRAYELRPIGTAVLSGRAERQPAGQRPVSEAHCHRLPGRSCHPTALSRIRL